MLKEIIESVKRYTELEKQAKIEKDLVPVKIEDILKKVKKTGEVVTIFYFNNGFLYSEDLSYYKNRFRIGPSVWSEKSLKDYFSDIYLEK
jgi:hypothetical protein